jgi:hypothetical protein
MFANGRIRGGGSLVTSSCPSENEIEFPRLLTDN